MRLKLAIGTAVIAAGVAAPGAFAQVVVAPKARTAQIMRTERAYLGIGVKDVDPDGAKRLNLKEVRGVEITQVEENSPAAKAGIKDGDVVLEYNGQQVEGGEQLSRLVRETPIGRTVRIGVWRGSSMQNLSATIEASKGPMIIAQGGGPMAIPEFHMPEIQSFRFPEGMPGIVTANSPTIGIIGEPLSNQDQLADFFGVKDGVLVKQVNRNSAAEKAGLKAGDVIVKVEGSSVSTARDITRVLRDARGKKTVTLTVVRAKKEMPITVTIESASTLGTPVRALLQFGPGFYRV
jgi:serine protease Do